MLVNTLLLAWLANVVVVQAVNVVHTVPSTFCDKSGRSTGCVSTTGESDALSLLQVQAVAKVQDAKKSNEATLAIPETIILENRQRLDALGKLELFEPWASVGSNKAVACGVLDHQRVHAKDGLYCALVTVRSDYSMTIQSNEGSPFYDTDTGSAIESTVNSDRRHSIVTGESVTGTTLSPLSAFPRIAVAPLAKSPPDGSTAFAGVCAEVIEGSTGVVGTGSRIHCTGMRVKLTDGLFEYSSFPKTVGANSAALTAMATARAKRNVINDGSMSSKNLVATYLTDNDGETGAMLVCYTSYRRDEYPAGASAGADSDLSQGYCKVFTCDLNPTLTAAQFATSCKLNEIGVAATQTLAGQFALGPVGANLAELNGDKAKGISDYSLNLIQWDDTSVSGESSALACFAVDIKADYDADQLGTGGGACKILKRTAVGSSVMYRTSAVDLGKFSSGVVRNVKLARIGTKQATLCWYDGSQTKCTIVGEDASERICDFAPMNCGINPASNTACSTVTPAQRKTYCDEAAVMPQSGSVAGDYNNDGSANTADANILAIRRANGKHIIIDAFVKPVYSTSHLELHTVVSGQTLQQTNYSQWTESPFHGWMEGIPPVEDTSWTSPMARLCWQEGDPNDGARVVCKTLTVQSSNPNTPASGTLVEDNGEILQSATDVKHLHLNQLGEGTLGMYYFSQKDTDELSYGEKRGFHHIMCSGDPENPSCVFQLQQLNGMSRMLNTASSPCGVAHAIAAADDMGVVSRVEAIAQALPGKDVNVTRTEVRQAPLDAIMGPGGER